MKEILLTTVLLFFLCACDKKHLDDEKRQTSQLCTIKGPWESSLKLNGDKALIWDQKFIKVWFLDDEWKMRKEVMDVANQWAKYTGTKFIPAASENDSDIRVTFVQDGWWSYIGTIAQEHNADQEATLSLDSLHLYHSVKRTSVILHEFGHSLGLIHEHQNPKFKIDWNESALFDYYKDTYKVDSVWVRANVIEKYDSPSGFFCTPDEKSIMIYEIPKGLTNDPNFEIPEPLQLSTLDKINVKLLYTGKKCS